MSESMMSKPLICYIYRSERKADTYLYLAEKGNFSLVPVELLTIFGEAEFCFELKLSAERTLAKEDPQLVYDNLRENGFHLQLADSLLIEQRLALKGLN